MLLCVSCQKKQIKPEMKRTGDVFPSCWTSSVQGLRSGALVRGSSVRATGRESDAMLKPSTCARGSFTYRLNMCSTQQCPSVFRLLHLAHHVARRRRPAGQPPVALLPLEPLARFRVHLAPVRGGRCRPPPHPAPPCRVPGPEARGGVVLLRVLVRRGARGPVYA